MVEGNNGSATSFNNQSSLTTNNSSSNDIIPSPPPSSPSTEMSSTQHSVDSKGRRRGSMADISRPNHLQNLINAHQISYHFVTGGTSTEHSERAGLSDELQKELAILVSLDTDNDESEQHGDNELLDVDGDNDDRDKEIHVPFMFHNNKNNNEGALTAAASGEMRFTGGDDSGSSSHSHDRHRETLALKSIQRRMTKVMQYHAKQHHNVDNLIEVRMHDVSYHVPVKKDSEPSQRTVWNESLCFSTYRFFGRMKKWFEMKSIPMEDRPNIFLTTKKKEILHNINLVFKPGKSYLILGPPGCGKTTLLKLIAGRVKNYYKITGEPREHKPYITGRIGYNGISHREAPEMFLENIASFVEQLDDHAPLLTVKETFAFASHCRTGKFDNNNNSDDDEEEESSVDNDSDNDEINENLTIDGLGLKHVSDTFVGNKDVRGVSGGQRRRVTVGEMMQGQNPVACADEISTGLDAASTYDMIKSIVYFAKAAKTTRIVSLLQPGPETFTLFDEVVILSAGYVLYAGPVSDVVSYFDNLGYNVPPSMDIADFLVSVSTPDGKEFLLSSSSGSDSHDHYTPEQFANEFYNSKQGQNIRDELKTPYTIKWTVPNSSKNDGPVNRIDKELNSIHNSDDEDEDVETAGGCICKKTLPKKYTIKYVNSHTKALMLNFRRHLTLWKRDIGYIIGKTAENIGMSLTTGLILLNTAKLKWDDCSYFDSIEDKGVVITDEYKKILTGVQGGLFMAVFHLTLGTMTSTPDEIDFRGVHYKHADANFYQSSAFVIGRLASTFPQRLIEILAFGIPLYFCLGLALEAGPFFIYLLILLTYTITVKMLFGILPMTLPTKGAVQEVGMFVLLLMTMFGGFIVYPDTIPNYYQWIYWLNPFSWAYLALLNNEFTSSKYDQLAPCLFGGNQKWNQWLYGFGFKAGRQWIGYAFAFMIPFSLICGWVISKTSKYVRHYEIKAVKKKIKEDAETGTLSSNLPFTPVNITFENVCYEVKASTGNETIQLLDNISGALMGGRMCALMGSSGAGKTTLMDVISLRKESGTITGDIRLNGFPQEKVSFLRCSGYVEQFDVQSAELTVRETVAFSARLRLDSRIEDVSTDSGKMEFVDKVLHMMELTSIKNQQVGDLLLKTGLSFEQRKRLSIAVELAGSPSIIFLDEPTSGLDSRGAMVVMRAMKRIADTGRTVCATIHQPSAAVFEMFDDLILLKKGGKLVFFGDLGPESIHLTTYFESRGSSPIEYGENPASWMLTASEIKTPSEWAEEYKLSDQYNELIETIEAERTNPNEEKKISYEKKYSTSWKTRQHYTNVRLHRIYTRSPAYNNTRLMLALIYAFIVGSVFLQFSYDYETPWTENRMEAIYGIIFFSLIIVGVASISFAIPVVKNVRDVFYKHRASGMTDHHTVAFSLEFAEIPYIILVSVLFGLTFYATTGLFSTARAFWDFILFFTLNTACYSIGGQLFISLVKDIPTSMALVGALVGMNIFFSGFIVKPEFFKGPFLAGFWTSPGRFAYEGIVMSQFNQHHIPVDVTFASGYFFYLGCSITDWALYYEDNNNTAWPEVINPWGNETCSAFNYTSCCQGDMSSYTNYAFRNGFTEANRWVDIVILCFVLVLFGGGTHFALGYFNYVNT